MRGLFNRVEKREVIGIYDPIVGMFNERRFAAIGQSTVTSDRAMRHMAVWRCKHLLADLVSGLPIDQFRAQGKDRKRMPQSEFVRTPSDLIEQDEWCYALMLSALDCGNGFALVTKWGSDGLARRAEVVPHEQVSVTQRGFLDPPEYKIADKVVDSDKILHLRAFGPAPGSVMGMSPIRAMAPTVSLGLAVRDFGSSWYGSGGHPTSVLTTQQTISEDVATAAKEKFRAATTGDHIAVLGNAWQLQSVQQSPSDSLFLNATNATTVDICGYYGIPPEFLGYANAGAGSVTYANREQRILDLLTMTVGWWVGRIERLISRQIPQPQFVKKNVDELLRSDAATRWQIHNTAVNMGAMSNDEVRRIEDEEPIPGGQGNQYLWPPAGVRVLVDDQGNLVGPTTPVPAAGEGLGPATAPQSPPAPVPAPAPTGGAKK